MSSYCRPLHKGERYKAFKRKKKRLDQQGDEETESKACAADVLRHDLRHQVFHTIAAH